MRRSFPVAFALVALASLLSFSARVARAGEDEDAKPAFSVSDIALAQDGLPEGWKEGPAEPVSADAKAVQEDIDAIAKAKGEETFVAARPFATADGKAVVLVLVDSDKDPKAFAAAVKESAAKHGWGYRELGSPGRIVVAAGPEDARAKAIDAQVAYGAKMLGGKAEKAIESRLFARAMALAKGGLTIDGKSAKCHLVLGQVHGVGAQQEAPGFSYDEAIKHLKAALSADATGPLTGDALIEAYGELGGVYLNVKPPKDAEGRDALQEAVKRLAGSTAPRNLSLTYRYNLACAHGRLKEKEESFKLLTAILEEMAKEPAPALDSIWRTDADFTNLKDDPRWDALLKKYPQTAGGGDMGGN